MVIIGQQWKDKTLVKKKVPIRIEETEAETVRFIYKLYASGMGYKAIVNRLNKGGKQNTSRNGKETVQINLQGKWLERWGFSIGAGIRADCYQNRLIIVKEKE